MVLPYSGSSTDRCKVIFDYWLEAGAVQCAAATVPGFSNPSSTTSVLSSSSSSSSSGSCTPAVLEAARRSSFVLDSLQDSHKVQVGASGAAVSSCLYVGCLYNAVWLLGHVRAHDSCLHMATLRGWRYCATVVHVPAASGGHAGSGFTCVWVWFKLFHTAPCPQCHQQLLGLLCSSSVHQAGQGAEGITSLDCFVLILNAGCCKGQIH